MFVCWSLVKWKIVKFARGIIFSEAYEQTSCDSNANLRTHMIYWRERERGRVLMFYTKVAKLFDWLWLQINKNTLSRKHVVAVAGCFDSSLVQRTRRVSRVFTWWNSLCAARCIVWRFACTSALRSRVCSVIIPFRIVLFHVVQKKKVVSFASA